MLRSGRALRSLPVNFMTPCASRRCICRYRNQLRDGAEVVRAEANSTHNGQRLYALRRHLRLVTRDGILTIGGVSVGPIYGGTAPELDFGALLGVLGYTDNEFLSVTHRNAQKDAPMIAEVLRTSDVAAHVAKLPSAHDVYFGINPVAKYVQSSGGRGKAVDVTRLVALPVDLDVKPGACADLTVAHAIIDDLSEVIGIRPLAVIHSGKGLQPLWVIAEGARNDTIDIAVVLRRWGQLVKATARARDVELDSVFDLPRVLRVPGTMNNKYEAPMPVSCYADTGRAVTLTEIATKLSEFRVDGEAKSVGILQSNPDDWRYSDKTCSYVTEMIEGWNRDLPTNGRHPWLLNQSVRLACAVRLGCVTEPDHQHGYQVLARRMVELRAATSQSVPLRELVKAFAFGPEIAATKTDDQARAEVGGHMHRDHPIGGEYFWSSRPALTDLQRFARSRRVGPWAVLGHVLARAVAGIPPTVVLPPLVGSYASLNLFVALVGPSGAGKGGAGGAAADWLTTEPPTFTATLGSGEGLAKMFAYKQRVKGNAGPWIQTGLRASVVFDAPEVDNLTALTTRSSSTLLPQLRSAYSGEELGFSYADPAKAVRLCAHRYRLCLTLGVQPGRGKALLEDADGGTPQRFIWLPTDDMDAPDELPESSAVHKLGRWPHQPVGRLLSSSVAPEALLDTPLENAALQVLGAPDAAREAIDSHRVAVLRGGEVDPLDGHRLLCRLKVAAAFMRLDGRTNEITEDDWRLAGIVMAVSDYTRASVSRTLQVKATAENASRGRAEGLREIAKTEVVEIEHVERLQRVADNIARKLKDSGGELARGVLRKMISHRDRPLFDEAEDLLIDNGRIEKIPSGNSGPGGHVVRLAGEGAGK
jgi:hypothetical protein